MPFTISHTAAVIPFFRWKRLDPAALVIGSVTPDMGYFVHRFDIAGKAHTLSGSFACALPIACCLWLFCRCFAIPLASPLPEPWRSGLRRALTGRSLKPADAFWIPVAALIGIGSHNVIDSFTHTSGWSVQRISFLRSPWPLAGFLQHLGSLAGMVVLAVLCRRTASREPGIGIRWSGRHTVLAILAAAAALVALDIAWEKSLVEDGAIRWRPLTFRWVVGSMALFGSAYLMLGAFLAALDRWKTGKKS